MTGHRPPTTSRPPGPGGLVRTLLTAFGTLVVGTGFVAGCLRPPRPVATLLSHDPAHPDGNLLAIRAELARVAPDLVVHEIGYRTRDGLRGALTSAREALALGYHLAADRLVVADNWMFPLFTAPGRRGTTRVQVWHAAGAFKRFGFSLADTGTPLRSNYDLCLASSSRAAALLAEPFRLPPERFTSAIGMPRTDVLYDRERSAAAIQAVRARYGLAADTRLLLYAPTFRSDPGDARHPDDLDLRVMRDRLAPEWRLLRRLHPLVRDLAPVPSDLADFVVDVSDWPVMNDLLLVADMLVTDFSSTIFEYALLGRPMAFFAPDLDAYATWPGFYIAVPDDLPGPVFRATDALAEHVRGGTFDIDQVHAFAQCWFDVADGHAAERFAELIALPAVRGERIQVGREPAPHERQVLPVEVP